MQPRTLHEELVERSPRERPPPLREKARPCVVSALQGVLFQRTLQLPLEGLDRSRVDHALRKVLVWTCPHVQLTATEARGFSNAQNFPRPLTGCAETVRFYWSRRLAKALLNGVALDA